MSKQPTCPTLSGDDETLLQEEDVGPLADHGDHDIPYDASDIPLLLSANDAPPQRDVEAAVYEHGVDVPSDDHVVRFHNAPVAPLSFTYVRHLWWNGDKDGALCLLSCRNKLEIDEHLTVDITQPKVLPAVGPHFLDLVMYIGDRQGLDAVLPNVGVDHTWHVELDFTGIHCLWPESKQTRLPFDQHGRMMYIGTRNEEQVWILMVPNEWLAPDHPFNATGIWPKLPDPSTTMSSKHALMLVMFFAHIFNDMRLRDFACRNEYLQALTRNSVNEATDIFYRHGETSRAFNLRITDLERVHHQMVEHWDDWVRQAPDLWKADRFLLDSTPVAVTMCYSQNQSILVPNSLELEKVNWKRDHRYENIKHFTFSIALHIRILDVTEWEDLPPEEVAAKYPVAYDCYDPDTCEAVDLRRYPRENAFGDAQDAYDADGYRIVREKVVSYCPTSTLIDLSLAHTLFQTNPDDFGHILNNVKYNIYPLGFTRNLGNVQADSVITSFARRMNLLDDKLRGVDDNDHQRPCQRGRRHRDGPDMNFDSGNKEEEAMDVEEPDERRGNCLGPILHAISCQIYNAISHRVHNAAKFHEVQLGLVTSSLAGSTSTSLPSKNRWRRTADRCRGGLPHVYPSEKISGDGQPQCMRFENTPAPQSSAVIHVHNNTPAAIARHTSKMIIEKDSHGDWSALEVTLKYFHTVLHKSVLPCEILEASFEASSREYYIVDAYNWAVATYNPSKPLHHLALIASIACAGILPKVFAENNILQRPPQNPSQYASFIRDLDWISRGTRTRGVNDTQIFIRMVTLFIICMYEHDSPILRHLRIKDKSTTIKKWLVKNSAKGITAFLLVRLGVAKVKSQKAFGSVQWNVDIRPLLDLEIASLYQNVISRIKRDQIYGSYDAIEFMMGRKTAELLADNGFVNRCPTGDSSPQLDTSAPGGNAKRGEREWVDDEIYVCAEDAGLQGKKHKVSRTYY